MTSLKKGGGGGGGWREGGGGGCYGLSPLSPLPSIICHSRLVYIQSLTTASGSRLFGLVCRALDFYPGRPDSNPTIGGKFIQLCFIPS